MKLAAEPGCAALFEPPAVGQALLEVQAAVALARAEAGLQSWASAREVEAARRMPDPVSQDLLDTALLMQTRRALLLIEAHALASAQALLALADAHDPRLSRPWLARGLGLLLGGIEPLRLAAAGLQLPWGGDEAVAAILARNLGLALPQGQGSQPGVPSAWPSLLVDTHRAMAELREALQSPDHSLPPSPLPDEPEAERLLAHWRQRLPHLLREAYGHEDPRRPAD